jgi:hypothetical protein
MVVRAARAAVKAFQAQVAWVVQVAPPGTPLTLKAVAAVTVVTSPPLVLQGPVVVAAVGGGRRFCWLCTAEHYQSD